MKKLGEMLRRARSSFLRISFGIHGPLNPIEKGLQAQGRRLHGLEEHDDAGTHSLEVRDDNRREIEIARHEMLTDNQLRVDLNRKYGPTKWAAKLINEIMTKRALRREVSTTGLD